MIGSSFSFIYVATRRVCYQASLAIIFSIWALKNKSAFDYELHWASHWGALMPSSLMTFSESWRIVTAPLLHVSLSHLLSNLTLLFIATTLQGLEKNTQFKSFGAYYRQFAVTHDWLSPIYLLGWGCVITSVRTIIGVEAWSLGLSGVAMMFVSKSCLQLATRANKHHEELKISFSQRLFLCLAPWILALASCDEKIDFSSHVIGTALGSFYGFWLAKTSYSSIKGESGKI